MSLVSAFRFPADPRMMVVSRIEDFALLRQPGVLGVMMPNPVAIPDSPEEIAAIMEFTRSAYDDGISFLNRSELEDVRTPACIRETGLLIFEAIQHAGRNMGDMISLRQNVHPPIKPHSHRLTGMADIFGTTTVGYLGEHERELHGRYNFLRRHISAFRDIWHEAGIPEPGTDRLNMILG